MNYEGGVYFVLDERSDAMKIGKADILEERLKGLQTGNPNPLKVIHFIKCKSSGHSRLVESQLHKQFDHLRGIGEWFTYNKQEFQQFFYENIDFQLREKRSSITYSTLYGEVEFGIKEFPSCYFYPELTAQIMDSYENSLSRSIPFRTMEWDTGDKPMLGKWSNAVNRVFISTKKHKENLLQKRFEEAKKSKLEKTTVDLFSLQEKISNP
jgi:hypothetical protein